MADAPQRKTRREMLEEHVASKPGDAFARYGLALEYMNSGDTSAADSQFKKLLETSPDYVPAYLMYAQLLQRDSRAEEAKRVLQEGVSRAAQKGDAHARSELESLLADLA
jgi:Tfp pilus assembly protein PilF